MPDNKRVNIIKTNTQIRALGFGVLGTLGLFLIAQITSLTVSLTTLPQSVFLDICSSIENLAYTYLYAKIERNSFYLITIYINVYGS